jgi:hypothetical protein
MVLVPPSLHTCALRCLREPPGHLHIFGPIALLRLRLVFVHLMYARREMDDRIDALEQACPPIEEGEIADLDLCQTVSAF